MLKLDSALADLLESVSVEAKVRIGEAEARKEKGRRKGGKARKARREGDTHVLIVHRSREPVLWGKLCWWLFACRVAQLGIERDKVVIPPVDGP